MDRAKLDMRRCSRWRMYGYYDDGIYIDNLKAI